MISISMNKKSLYHALLAAGYITTVVSCMNLITQIPHQPEDNIFMPITMLALLVLSVAVMAFLFFYHPMLLLIDGKRKEAVGLFLGTIVIFAAFTVLFMVLAMYIIP